LLQFLPQLHSYYCFSSWEKKHEPQRKEPTMPKVYFLYT
jgi:hypothetical protein